MQSLKYESGIMLFKEKLSKYSISRGLEAMPNVSFKITSKLPSNTLGQCNTYGRYSRVILLNSDFVMSTNDIIIREIIIHELAHAYIGNYFNLYGHMFCWKNMAQILGSTGNIFHDSSISLEMYSHVFKNRNNISILIPKSKCKS